MAAVFIVRQWILDHYRDALVESRIGYRRRSAPNIQRGREQGAPDVIQGIAALIIQVQQFVAMHFDENSVIDQETRDVDKISTMIMIQKVEAKTGGLQRWICNDEVLDILGQTAQSRLAIRTFESCQSQA
jgi:hypothetical protein